MRQLTGVSRTAAEVVMDEALIQDDGIDLIVEKVDRCWEVTQDQGSASKIEKALFETEGRQNGNDIHVISGTDEGTPPAAIKGYGTLRDAKHAESSYDKVVMWTGGSYDYDDVMRALVRLDRPEMRPGTSGQPSMDQPHSK